jgi:hypothetical protein
MPRECRYCGGIYCTDHLIPEKHGCDMVATRGSVTRRSESDEKIALEPIEPGTVGSTPKENPPEPPAVRVRDEREHGMFARVRSLFSRLF